MTRGAAGRHAGRTAVITGGALGIGRELARRLAAEGAYIVIADVEPAAETCRLIEREGTGALALRCDVAEPDDVAMLAEAVARFGGADILVHNAALYPKEGLAEATFASWRRVMAVNLDALFLLAKAFVPAMAERGWGRVVGIGTGMLHDGVPGALPYVASKGGVVGFVRALAGEVGAAGVTVNAISPGLTHSHGTAVEGVAESGLFELLAQAQAIKRNGMPADIAGALSFLVSDDASWITGQTLLVDGGKAFL